MTGQDTNPDLISHNPATGAEIGRVPSTPPASLPTIVARAREAQVAWASTPWRDRRDFLVRWHRVYLRRADAIAALAREEIGKPMAEAMGAEVLASLDHLRWVIRFGGRALASRSLKPHWQRLMMMSAARVEWRPVGVAGIIGAWNYPFLLNVPLIAQAVAAGNAVVWKPSELACLCGRLLQETLEAAGMPEGLVQIVQGGPDVGQALAASGVDKAWFTGGLGGGRAVLEELGKRGVPAVAELSGFDPAIVLPDAPIAKTAAALAWGTFVNAGQSCVGVKRIYVVGDPKAFASELSGRARALRVGDPAGAGIDVGPMISVGARDRFHAQIRASVEAGAEVLAGGEPSGGPGAFYPPTVLMATDDRQVMALEGCFGPVVAIKGVATAGEAVAAANASRFGLSASVWGKDRRRAREVAGGLEAGMVGVNEAVTFFAHLTAPAGGVKASGFGRVHGPQGLMEFVAARTVVERSAGGLRPQIYPYSGAADRAARMYLRLIHGAGRGSAGGLGGG
jgi:acyl-CoA reductase-like NAD-dependent aldehyde dehydrogenase